MRHVTKLIKLVVLISMVLAGLTWLQEQTSAQTPRRKPPHKFQRMATIDDLETRRESPVIIPIDRLRPRPLPAPVELPPFVKPGEKMPAGMLIEVERSEAMTPTRIDATKPIKAPEERKP